MSTPPVNQTLLVFHSISGLFASDYLPPLNSRANQSVSQSDNKTFYLCVYSLVDYILMRWWSVCLSLPPSSLQVKPSVRMERVHSEVFGFLGFFFEEQQHLQNSTQQQKKEYQCFTGNLMGKVCCKFVGQQYLMDIIGRRCQSVGYGSKGVF